MISTFSTVQMRRLVLFGSLLLFPVFSARGQSLSRSPGSDSLFRRARRMVSEGNGTAGRALVDSLLKGEAEGSKGYGDALYWHGALAETAADAERDYRRVIVEYPLSTYADDALLAIAELEQARGDREGALQHLQRFVKEHPASAARGTAAFAAARLAFEQRDARTGCAMLAEARTSVPATDVELRNQIDYFTPRCPASSVGANAVGVGIPANTPTAPPARDTTLSVAPVKASEPRSQTTSISKPGRPVPSAHEVKRPAVQPSLADKASLPAAPTTVLPRTKPAVQARGIYTIQLAAYNTRPDADRLVAKLRSNGVTARVSGTSKPFRVRLDFYPTRQAALDQVALLRGRGIIGFVTTEEPPPEGTMP